MYRTVRADLPAPIGPTRARFTSYLGLRGREKEGGTIYCQNVREMNNHFELFSPFWNSFCSLFFFTLPLGTSFSPQSRLSDPWNTNLTFRDRNWIENDFFFSLRVKTKLSVYNIQTFFPSGRGRSSNKLKQGFSCMQLVHVCVLAGFLIYSFLGRGGKKLHNLSSSLSWTESLLLPSI